MENIMIVDDHEDMRRVMISIIEKSMTQTFQFIECESGEEAIRRYLSDLPACVLLDYRLKGMNGFETATEILKMDAEANIILVTSYDTPSMRNMAEKLNLKGYVSKDNLAEIIHHLKTIT